MKKSLLLLEGGGYRGIFTSGVLDTFLDHDIEFDTVVGISSGALNGYNYVSKDLGRSKQIVFEYGQARDYFGLRNLIKTGSAFGADFVFNHLPNVIPFSKDTFINGSEFYVGATNCLTGEERYFPKSEGPEFIDCVVASSALPLVSKMVNINDTPFLDGGIASQLPLSFIDFDKYDRIVIVLTRPLSFRVKSTELSIMRGYRLFYKKYPLLLNALQNQSFVYNKQREYVEELQKKNKIYVVEPDERFKVKRLEKSEKIIRAGYDLGLEAGEKYIEYLNNKETVKTNS